MSLNKSHYFALNHQYFLFYKHLEEGSITQYKENQSFPMKIAMHKLTEFEKNASQIEPNFSYR